MENSARTVAHRMSTETVRVHDFRVHLLEHVKHKVSLNPSFHFGVVKWHICLIGMIRISCNIASKLYIHVFFLYPKQFSACSEQYAFIHLDEGCRTNTFSENTTEGYNFALEMVYNG